MKFLLKFVLLFALIVVGKLAKESVTPLAATTKRVQPEAPVQAASFFARQVRLENTPHGGGSRLWQATAPSTTSRSAESFE
ncbi:hypothetical protein [Hymenobacter chitinivorans]|uniref:hypothetical protein n=1 Tax=Hymenobacter chitinivorans TaxID=89969 RepID=UPI0012FD042F|nr:hypothetical protein [Hymenobacter chitinivorans]